MKSQEKPTFQLIQRVHLDAPLRPAFRFLSNLKMRPWVDHGIGWKVGEVKIISQQQTGIGTESQWEIEINETKSSDIFKTTIYDENHRLTLENQDKTLIIEHTLSTDNDKTLLEITKTYFSDKFEREGESERLATLLDNLRVVLGRKPKK